MTDQRRVGFLFTTKDRVDFTLRSLRSIDYCGGFDLVWVDGSTTLEGKSLPGNIKLNNCRIAELHQHVRPKHTDLRSMRLGENLGSHTAIHFGLPRVIDLGYEYCGIIENDMEFRPGWFPKLMKLFELGRRDGFEVGAVTARSMTTRVLAYRPEYLVMWNIGAGMVLFTQQAARIIMATYAIDPSTKLAQFFKDNFGADFSDVWELWFGQPDRNLSPDWSFSMHLYKHGLISLGTLPSLAFHMDLDIETMFRSSYVTDTPATGDADEASYSRVKDFISRQCTRSAVGRQLSFAIDCARGSIFRAQVHSKAVRDLIYVAKHLGEPEFLARVAHDRARKWTSRMGR